MKTDTQRTRAIKALIPTWPQVRTFTAEDVVATRAAADAFLRNRDVRPDPIGDWVQDITRRAKSAGISVQREVTGLGASDDPAIMPEPAEVTITIRPRA